MKAVVAALLVAQLADVPEPEPRVRPARSWLAAPAAAFGVGAALGVGLLFKVEQTKADLVGERIREGSFLPNRALGLRQQLSAEYAFIAAGFMLAVIGAVVFGILCALIDWEAP